jgi:hypothetical protein
MFWHHIFGMHLIYCSTIPGWIVRYSGVPCLSLLRYSRTRTPRDNDSNELKDIGRRGGPGIPGNVEGLDALEDDTVPK